MDRDSAVSIILQRLGNRSAAEYQTACETEMRQVQENKLEGSAELMPWFLITEETTAATVAGEQRVAVPDDFLLEVEEAALMIQDAESGNWIPLVKDDFDDLTEAYVDEDDAQPVKYSLLGGYFRLFPTPDAVYQLKMIYFGRDAVLNSNIENNWLKYASDLMIAATGEVMAAQYLQDTELAAIFTNQIQTARDRLWKLNEARQHAGRNYQMGDD